MHIIVPITRMLINITWNFTHKHLGNESLSTLPTRLHCSDILKQTRLDVPCMNNQTREEIRIIYTLFLVCYWVDGTL